MRRSPSPPSFTRSCASVTLSSALPAWPAMRAVYLHAARLFGAADALRQRTGEVRFEIFQADYQASVRALRDAIGDEGFASGWAEGAAPSIDEAIAYAQRGRGERKRPTSGWASLTPTERDVDTARQRRTRQQRHRHAAFRITTNRPDPPHPRLHEAGSHVPRATRAGSGSPCLTHGTHATLSRVGCQSWGKWKNAYGGEPNDGCAARQFGACRRRVGNAHVRRRRIRRRVRRSGRRRCRRHRSPRASPGTPTLPHGQHEVQHRSPSLGRIARVPCCRFISADLVARTRSHRRECGAHTSLEITTAIPVQGRAAVGQQLAQSRHAARLHRVRELQ